MTDDEAIEKLQNEVGLEGDEITQNLIELAKESGRGVSVHRTRIISLWPTPRTRSRPG